LGIAVSYIYYYLPFKPYGLRDAPISGIF
jgi:hypothetical protein